MRGLGIDFGTRSLRAAIVERNVAHLLELAHGAFELPACISWAGRAPTLGASAVELAITHAESTVSLIKLFLGRPRTHPSVAAQVARLLVGIEPIGSRVGFLTKGVVRPAEQVAGALLEHLLGAAVQRLGERPGRVVISVPAWFLDDERRALLDAALRASLEGAELILDPTAIAATTLRTHRGRQVIGVVDVGAGGVSVGFFQTGHGEVQLLGAAGEESGGEAADELLSRVVLAEIERSGSVARDPATAEMLRQAVEKMKRTLGDQERVVVPIELERARVAEVIEPVLDRLEVACFRASESAKVSVEGCDAIYLAGGMLEVPAVRERILRTFGSKVRLVAADPGSVALGAARIAASRAGEIAPIDVRETPKPLSSSVVIAPVEYLARTTEDLAVEAHRGQDFPFSPRSGRLLYPSTPAQLLGLAITRRLEQRDIEPIALPVLLFAVLARQKRSGTLTLDSGERKLTFPIHRGVALLKKVEQGGLINAFKWRGGTYSLDSESPIDQAGRQRHSLLRLTVEGLRLALRAYTEEELRSVFSDRLALAPEVPAELASDLERFGLLPNEQRIAKHNLDGSVTLDALLSSSGGGRHTTLQLVSILTLFDHLDWKTVQAAPGRSLAEEVEARAAEIAAAPSYFDVLGVHWSASTPDIEEAYNRLMADASAQGDAGRAAPDACARIRARVAVAYQALRHEGSRLQHRRETYPDVDFSAVADILTGALESAELRGDQRGLAEARVVQREVERTRSSMPSRTPTSDLAAPPATPRVAQTADLPPRGSVVPGADQRRSAGTGDLPVRPSKKP